MLSSIETVYVLFVLFFISISIYLSIVLYGTYLAFKKKWYIGLAALLVPGFSLIVGLYKIITKKDLIK